MMQTAPSPTTPTSAASSLFHDADDTLLDDGMAQELAKLEELRRSVRKNLLLRPLSTNNLRAAAAGGSSTGTSQASSATTTTNGNPSVSVTSLRSPETQIPGSYPFTPATAAYAHQALPNPPHSAASTASDVFYSARPLSTNSITAYYFNDGQSPGFEGNSELVKSPMSAAFAPPGSFPRTPFMNLDAHVTQPPAISRPPPRPVASRSSTASSFSKEPLKWYSPTELMETLLPLAWPSGSPRLRPLLLDTRPSGSYLASRLIYSINVAIPSLILKRHRKSLLKGGEGLKDMETLKGYVSTEAGKRNWDELLPGADEERSGVWNGEIIVFDEDMDENDPMAPVLSPSTTPSSTGSNISTPSSTAWMLLTLLRPLTNGPLYYLKGGVTALRKEEGSEEVIVSGEWEIEDEEGSEGSDAAGSSDAQSLGQSSTASGGVAPSSEAHTTPKRPLGSFSNDLFDYKLPNSGTPKTLASTPKSFQLKTLGTTSSPKPISGSPNPRGVSQGLFSIRTDVAAKHRPLPEIEPPTTSPKLEDRMPEKERSRSPPGGQILLTEPHRSTRDGVPMLRPPPSPRKALTIATDVVSPEANRTPLQLPERSRPALPSLHIKSQSQVSAEGDSYNRRRDVGHGKSSSVGSVGSDGSTPQSVKTPPSAIDLKNYPHPAERDRAHGAKFSVDGSSLVDGRRPSALHIPSLAQATPQAALQRPRLAKLDMSSAEKLKKLATDDTQGKDNNGPPKLQLRTVPKSNTLAIDQGIESRPSAANGGGAPKLKVNLGKLNLAPVQTSNVMIVNTPSSPEASNSYLDVREADWENSRPPPSPGTGVGSSFNLGAPPSRPRTPKSPLTPLLPPSPMTARPGGGGAADPTSPVPVFTISTILPGFLYLGPELVKEEHAKELEELGVKRILNIAIECDDDAGLRLRERFEKYIRIPMRDTVEEVNVRKACKEVCEIIDDARLHSAPTYVHCKAGKSRSVTAVMAYLIHANHWTLSKAYAFVLDRRKGISPNIGFVSELMNFEEDELGGKSVGVIGSQPGGGGRRGHHHHRNQSKNDGSSTARRRPAYLRESMPPVVQSYSAIATVGEHDSFSSGVGSGFPGGGGDGATNGETVNGQLMSAGPLGPKGGGLRDAGEEMEVRDSEGRYRHARRAPVDELTLQPIRRVSKAGLETWADS